MYCTSVKFLMATVLSTRWDMIGFCASSRYFKMRNAILLTLLAVVFVPIANAQYPKPISLTVTKITRVEKESPACANCTLITTVEAHTATAGFVLVCESNSYPEHPENNSVCSQFETGTYQARMLSPEVITFWPDNSSGEQGARRILYSVRVEEAREKPKQTPTR